MNIKSILFGCLAGLLLAACTEQSTNTTQQNTPQKKVLTVATDATFPPFEMTNNNNIKDLTGFDLELIQAIATARNLDINIQHTPWEDLFSSLDRESDILISSITIN